jgi:hypothetical protein
VRYSAVNNYLASGKRMVKVDSGTMASDTGFGKTRESIELCASSE